MMLKNSLGEENFAVLKVIYSCVFCGEFISLFKINSNIVGYI